MKRRKIRNDKRATKGFFWVGIISTIIFIASFVCICIFCTEAAALSLICILFTISAGINWVNWAIMKDYLGQKRRIKMICISDHAEVLLIYYEVLNEWEDIDEFYKEQSDAEKRAEKFAKESDTDFFTNVYQVKVIQDGNRIYTMSYYLKHF